MEANVLNPLFDKIQSFAHGIVQRMQFADTSFKLDSDAITRIPWMRDECVDTHKKKK